MMMWMHRSLRRAGNEQIARNEKRHFSVAKRRKDDMNQACGCAMSDAWSNKDGWVCLQRSTEALDRSKCRPDDGEPQSIVKIRMESRHRHRSLSFSPQGVPARCACTVTFRSGFRHGRKVGGFAYGLLWCLAASSTKISQFHVFSYNLFTTLWSVNLTPPAFQNAQRSACSRRGRVMSYAHGSACADAPSLDSLGVSQRKVAGFPDTVQANSAVGSVAVNNAI
ncbi:hypothetical protein IWX46DRAFT_235458 [Phyllosticta citricarpa]|uniref:Uncharacterized protein n=1 Tax=Phyllosticta citricarpa TaxID=55181 RepID=A0ABR1LUS7_9PEZI